MTHPHFSTGKPCRCGFTKHLHPKPKHNKFFTDLDQHKRGRLKHNLKWGFPPKHSAIDPEFLNQWIQKHGPYLYHGTNAHAVKHILQDGLYPQESMPDEPKNHWDARPGHVYLGTESYVRGGYFLPHSPQSVMLKIDLRHLDPNRFNADEDHWNARLERDHPAIRRAWRIETPPEDRWPTDDSMGDWAERTRIGDAPGETEYSLGQGSIAHEGAIPSGAISLMQIGQEPITAATDSDHFEAKMYHGSPHGLLREIKIPFVMTDTPTDHPVSHEVSVRFKRPAFHWGLLTPDHLDEYGNQGYDGVVAKHPGSDGTMSTWAIALDPGTVVPGHDHEFPYK